MEEESPGCSVGKLSSLELERIDREGAPFCLLFLFATHDSFFAILSRKDPYDHISSIL